VTYTYDQTRNGGAASGRLTGLTDSLGKANVPEYMVKGGNEYRLITDQ
jgi:hypothetical protein